MSAVIIQPSGNKLMLSRATYLENELHICRETSEISVKQLASQRQHGMEMNPNISYPGMNIFPATAPLGLRLDKKL